MAINFLNMLTIDCPTLAEATITFHGTYGYILILLITIIADIALLIFAVKLTKFIINKLFTKRGKNE